MKKGRLREEEGVTGREGREKEGRRKEGKEEGGKEGRRTKR